MDFYQKFYPKKVYKNVLEIKSDFLKENNIKAIFLDVDNTIIDYDNNVLEGIEEWIENLKKEGIKFCILSNTNKKTKAEKMSNLLNIPFVFFAIKPFKRGFNKAKQKIKITDNSQIAVVGDQIMTDVFGANRCNMYSILVEPIKSKDIFVTRFNRILERKILNKYYNQEKRLKDVHKWY